MYHLQPHNSLGSKEGLFKVNVLETQHHWVFTGGSSTKSSGTPVRGCRR